MPGHRSTAARRPVPTTVASAPNTSPSSWPSPTPRAWPCSCWRRRPARLATTSSPCGAASTRSTSRSGPPRGAAHALDEAGERAAEHLRTVDRLTEAASRSVGAALAESGAHASEAALEQLDSWADLSRIESEGLHQYRRDRWDLANALESLNDLREAEARRLQQLIERRAGLMASLTDLLAQQADAARAVTDAG